MMRTCGEQKEDIRLRMAELELKLAESEEERSKLEKTCNVLMRAFREEEKIRYKALNKKYEKFLEDCSVRRRRNEIILRSLCRIEDRSRALFAKTERLKLLKDRYESYLKIDEIKQEEVSHFWKSFPSADGVIARSDRWKTPSEFSFKPAEDFREGDRNLYSRKVQRDLLFNAPASQSFDAGKQDPERSEVFLEGKSQSDNVKTSYSESRSDPDYPIAVEIKTEELARSRSGRIPGTTSAEGKKLENDPSEMIKTARTEVGGEKESIKKLNQALSEHSENDRTSPEDNAIDPDEIEPVTEQSKSLNRFQRIDNGVTSSPKARDEDSDLLDPVSLEKDFPEEKPLPQGLDGVDYENETYPESYYEQPVHHHNHTSIASDVILEEDETEEEQEAEGGHGATSWQQTTAVEPRTEVEPSDRGYLEGVVEASDLVKSRKSDSEKSSVGGKSCENERAAVDAIEKMRPAAKSNLIQMLESDSESFQIEHGDGVSGREDSDFDFSFGNN